MRWPGRAEAEAAARGWAARVAASRPVVGIALTGSYARGTWGVGSDLDLLVIVESADARFERRGLEWDTSELPLPTDLLVYTTAEWREMRAEGRRLTREVGRDALWLVGGPPT